MSLVETLAQFMSGEFDNREQAIENPVWFVHLRMWQRPTHLFASDSRTIFAEQAPILKVDQPYRQRFMRLQQTEENALTVQYYMLTDPDRVKGAGQNPELLKDLKEADLILLSGCFLDVTVQPFESSIRFTAVQPADCPCRFTFQGSTIQVALGFETTSDQFWSHDKGINPDTEQPIWGALLGAYEFKKRQQF